MTDPFEALARPHQPQAPRPQFTSELRARLVAALGLEDARTVPAIRLPERKPAMSTTTPAPTDVPVATAVR